MVLNPESKTPTVDLFKKSSTLDQEFQNSNNQLKFSIASLLSNVQLPTKKQLPIDQYQKSIKFDQQNPIENNNYLDLPRFQYKSSIKNWFQLNQLNWYNQIQKQNKFKDECSLANVNNKLNVESIGNQSNLNHQINSIQLNQQLNHQFNQQLNHQFNNQINNRTIQSSITNTQIDPSISNSIQLQSQLSSQLTSQLNTQISTQSPIQLTHQNSTSNVTSSSLQLNKKYHKSNLNQINSYLNSLNANQINSTSGKILTHQSSDSKKKRVRTIFKPEQLERLELEFEKTQYMVGHDRLKLAAELNLSEVQVKVWFQNRRIKYRRIDLEKKHVI